jgi:small-conductance mechanosensitive channel
VNCGRRPDEADARASCNSNEVEPIETAWYNETRVIGLSALDLSIAILAAVVAYVVMSVALRIAITTASRVAAHGTLHGAGSAAGAIGEVLSGTSRSLMSLTAILIGISTLQLAEPWASRLSHLWFLTLMLQVALWANRAVTIGLSQYFKKHAGEGAQASASSTLLSWAFRTAVWTVAILSVLANVGVNITAFIASLGIGGIAVALAVQNILGDLFASLAIAVDKPFEVGDFVGVGAFVGTVEYVGLKTTRIRALSGEQLVMSNADLLKQTVKNFRRMTTRRIVFTFGVTYDTTPEQAEAIPGLVRSIIESSDKVTFDRAHLKEFGADALNYEVVYIVLDPSYNVYMDLQQTTNLRLMRELDALGVRFAFPTRTIYVAGQVSTSVLPQDSSAAPAPQAGSGPALPVQAS